MKQETTINTVLIKTCSKCGCKKPLSEFSKDSRKKNGVSSHCKVCKRAQVNLYRKENSEVLKERARVNASKPERKEKKKRWVEQNKEKIKGYQKKQKNSEKRKKWYAKWVKENREKLNENSRRWRERHADKARASTRKWEIENPGACRLKMHKRRARMAEVDRRKVLMREIKQILRSDCSVCGSKKDIVIDHIIPISRGGRHAIGNLQPLCRFCNGSKGAKTMTEWKFHRAAP